ncbi:MAG TPA: peroxiredoxin [Pirellulaceae bacterium]|nr:peroxiredoxin [Pirellulaceae bacterium]
MMSTRKWVLVGMVVGLGCFVFSGVATAQDAPQVELQVGDTAPRFEGTDEMGKSWTLNDRIGKKFIVVYFYPADFTTGCTRQAEAWRDNMNALVDADIEVVGISGDSVENHKLFKDVWKLNFSLLADEEAEIPEQFGVPVRRGGRSRPRGPDRQPLLDESGEPLVLERNATFVRWTFVIGKDGKIAYKNTKVNPLKDSEQVLAFIQSVQASEE